MVRNFMRNVPPKLLVSQDVFVCIIAVHKGYSQEGLLVMALITLVLFMVGLALGCFIIWRVHNVYKKRGLEDLVRGEMRDEARKIMTGEDGEALRESLLKDETKRDAFREVAREQQRR
eukprot:gb/GECG01014278.1/.p1 GENE.gb/GECG01014278.1/~~gb/GECG01014278.1/.p1  ORF type:complete len:118 (+),score=14.35 gb/GECG01014278.1/:1-354(+)